MATKIHLHYILDGRAHFNMDRALVLVTHDSLEDAREDVVNWPEDSVIVDGDFRIVGYHPDWVKNE